LARARAFQGRAQWCCSAIELPTMSRGGIMYELRNRPEEHIITDADLERLLPVLSRHDGAVAHALQSELKRARIVAQTDVPADVVTMNSEVVCEDITTGAQRAIRVVYPQDVDALAGRISILAPMGAALLGLRVGQEIFWRVARGFKRVRVVAIRYQPESAGDFAL
jgi:regulator of nucleoside diphosphate kinase